MTQTMIKDDDCNIKLNATTEEMNEETLESMYKVQEQIYKLFSQCEMVELEANTINPVQQNIFIPLKSWRINLNGCYAIVKIQQRGLGGCIATIEVL